VTLIVLLSSLALLAPSQGLAVSAGPQQTLVPAGHRLAAGLYTWPDGPVGVVREGGELELFGPNRGDVARTVGPRANPIREVKPSIPIAEAEALEDVGYAAGGPIYSGLSGGALLMFVHLERYPTGDPQGGSYASIGLARSSDDGASWELLGEIFQQNLTYDRYREEPGRCGTDLENRRYGVSNTSFGQYVIRRDDGVPYFYIYGSDTQAPPDDGDTPCEVNLAVARARVSEVTEAAEEGEVSSWQKYDEGSWEEPALGGTSANVWPGLRRLSFDVSYNEELDRYLLAMVRPLAANRSGLEIATSADGVTWSAPALAFEAEGEIYAPTIVGTDADPRTSGHSFDVYYVHSPRGLQLGSRWADAALAARTLTLR
jgi:hypothetical protein